MKTNLIWEEIIMNLYEIDSRIIMAYENAVDQETGEIINDEAYETLNMLQMEFEQKTEGILLWIKNLLAEAEALKKEKQAFEERQKSVENKATSLKKYISNLLNGKKFMTEKVSVSWRKSETVEFTGEIMSLPAECIRLKEPEVNKTELKKMLKNGETIPGATLVLKQNIQIK